MEVFLVDYELRRVYLKRLERIFTSDTPGAKAAKERLEDLKRFTVHDDDPLAARLEAFRGVLSSEFIERLGGRYKQRVSIENIYERVDQEFTLLSGNAEGADALVARKRREVERFTHAVINTIKIAESRKYIHYAKSIPAIQRAYRQFRRGQIQAGRGEKRG